MVGTVTGTPLPEPPGYSALVTCPHGVTLAMTNAKVEIRPPLTAWVRNTALGLAVVAVALLGSIALSTHRSSEVQGKTLDAVRHVGAEIHDLQQLHRR